MHRATSSSRSVADRFNSYNTLLCTEIDYLTLSPLLSGKHRLYRKPMSTMCSLYTLGGKPFSKRIRNNFLSFKLTIHFNHDSRLSPLQRITLCQRVWHHSWLVVIRANYFNGYCCCQPLSTPGTDSLNHFACPSASYHAILYLCITLIIISLFWSFSTQNLQMWKSATIVDFATHFTSSTFVLTIFWEYLIFPT